MGAFGLLGRPLGPGLQRVRLAVAAACGAWATTGILPVRAYPTLTPSSKASFGADPPPATPPVTPAPIEELTDPPIEAVIVPPIGADLGAGRPGGRCTTSGETSRNLRPSSELTTPIFSTSTGIDGCRRKSTALRISSGAFWQMMMSRAPEPPFLPAWVRVIGTLS
nr:hypothetical protein GCM10025730_36530 [Promicromonospora thailandica]